MRCLILQVAALFLAANVMPSAPRHKSSPTAQATGQLSGTVTDINGARIADAKVAIEGDGTIRTVTTAQDGTYEVDLTRGIYRIRVSSPGFCPTRRAAFRFQSSTAVTFNFTLVVCALENVLIGENGKYIGEKDRYRMPFKEEVLPVKSASVFPLNLLIQYGERLKDKNVIQYKGFKIDSKCLGVIVTYNLLTIQADKVRFDKQTLKLEAEDNVIVEDGKQCSRAKKAEVDFNGREPIIRLTQ
jgi:hypothetical protein